MRSRAVVVAAVLGTTLVSGGWFVQAGLASNTSTRNTRARLFDQVMTHVERYYIDSVSDDDLYRKAVDGLLLELHDPHSVFLGPDRLAKLNESTTGRYAGVGIQMDVRDGWITVVTPLPGTPAEKAGIVTGDRLVEIDGRSTRGWTSDEALKALRGTPGSPVRTVVERPGSVSRLAFTLTRQEIRARSVQHAVMLRGDVGYVDLAVFSETSAEELRLAIDSLRGAGMRSLIFDLRGDPGGLLDQGVAIADLFLDPSQRIVSMRGRGRDAERDYVDRFPQAWPDMRLVVLVDSGSASASEIVAGALQDHDRALIVGTTSFGKGSAQSLFPMAEGGALKLTTALWFTPSGRSINKVRSTAEDEDGGDPLQALGEEAKRPRFRTDAGRTVLGGGGITPDVEVSDSAVTAMEHRLQVALGRNVPAFRDAMASYALSLRAKGVVTSPSFVVTPVMRAELYDRLRQRKLVIAPSVWEESAPIVNRLLGYSIARYVLGPAGEFARVTHDDPEINRSLSLLESAQTQSELFEKAARR